MFTGLILMAATAHAPPADLRDLAGARAAGGETQLLARGYALVRVETMRGGKLGGWWNGEHSQCVAIMAAEDRLQTIALVPANECSRRMKPFAGGRERDRLRPELDKGK